MKKKHLVAQWVKDENGRLIATWTVNKQKKKKVKKKINKLFFGHKEAA